MERRMSVRSMWALLGVIRNGSVFHSGEAKTDGLLKTMALCACNHQLNELVLEDQLVLTSDTRTAINSGKASPELQFLGPRIAIIRAAAVRCWNTVLGDVPAYTS
jgi:hypothetical protein